MSVKQRKKFVDYKCENCDRCMTECAVRHSKSKTLIGAVTETPPPLPRLLVDKVDGKTTMAVCQNCGKPRCIAACEFHAIIEYHDGNVVIDQKECVGCWACVNACPFGAIQKDKKRRIAINCDNCVGYEDLGCVKACPTKAIKEDEEYVDVEMCRI